MEHGCIIWKWRRFRFTLWPVDFRIGAIWFLSALFWARLLLHFFAKLPYTFIWVIACFLVGYSSSRYVWLPWSIQAGMCAVAFLYLGYLAKKYDVLDFVKHAPYIWIIALLIWIADIAFFGGMSMAMNNYGSRPILAAVGSIAGTLCTIGISQLFDQVTALGKCSAKSGKRVWLSCVCISLRMICCCRLCRRILERCGPSFRRFHWSY